MKKWLKVGALAAALVIILGLCLFANALVGNPVSKWLAARTAERHLEEVYSDKDYVIDRVGFSFKEIGYYAHIKSPSSPDSSFSLRLDMWGKLLLDTYESQVKNGGNTVDRLYMEYRTLVDEVLEASDYPFVSDIAFGDLHVAFQTPDYPADYMGTDYYYLVLEELVLDKQYDIRELAAKAGYLVIYVEDNEVSVERAAEILLELKELFDKRNVPFYAIDFVLEYPRSEDGTVKEGRIDLENFLYAYIYEEGMIKRVKAADEQY